ncbi:hypothetical protein JXJ21_14455 [candidate division KSB1 bacterium]|nr:hypothetical protein [candidate division KSB1 bacterium]
MIDLRNRAWLAWLQKVDPFSAGYLGCESPHHTIRLGTGLREFWAAMEPIIEQGDRIVGRMGVFGIGGFRYGSGIFCDADLAEQLKQQHPQWTAHLDALVTFWKSLEPGSRLHYPADRQCEDESLMSGLNVYWAGWGGHTVLGFDQVLAEGLEGIRDSIHAAQKNEMNQEKHAFRDALLRVCDGIERFALNYARAARALAAAETHEIRKAELLAIAGRCRQVPGRGARNFTEALQSFWFIHLLDGTDSPGRFDQFMYPFYQKDVAENRLTQTECQDWIDHLWKRFNDTRSWNVCVGGVKSDGEDGTNPLTFMALEATRRYRKVAPNLSLRFHSGAETAQNQQLWNKALEVIETGVGMPALYNDEVIVPALMRYDIPETDVRDYAMNGCSQVDIQGRSHMGLEDGELNLLKCLELALHDGFDPHTQYQLGSQTGDPREFQNFDALWQAYTQQVEFFTARMLNAANLVQQAHAETSPNLFRSLFVKDCIAEGVDFKAGGARYNHGQILTQGIANTADALAVIQKLIFEDRRITMDELLLAMRNNFPNESFRQMLIKAVPKYGNDDPVVDQLAARIIDHFFRHLNRYRTWRGGIYGGGSIVFVRAPIFGAKVGATPDGRKAGTPLADSVGPSQGFDTNGPTAMFNSVARIPQVLAQSTYVLNVKFTPQVLHKNREKIISLLKTYFRNGGQQIQVNVIDKSTLIQAKENPQQYENLVVRVGGYSDYFVRLSPELQEDIIARTEQVL